MSSPPARSTDEQEIMAAIDENGPTRQLVIANVTRDDAWVTIAASEAPLVEEWR